MVSLEVVEGQLLLKDQMREYMDRGDFLETWSYLDFFLGTYDGKTLKDTTVSRGRPGNVRVPYRGNSNRHGRCRVLRSVGHETMPYFPGRWFPKRDDDDENGLFHAAMLALLKPWRSLRDLKQTGQNFRDSFNEFMAHAPQQIHNIVENIQFFHECADSARKDRMDNTTFQDSFPSSSPQADAEDAADAAAETISLLVTDDDVDRAVDRPFSSRELLYADVAIGIGQICGALSEHEYSLPLNHPAYPATVDDLESFDAWDHTLASPPCDSAGIEQDVLISPSVQPNSTAFPFPANRVTEPNVALLNQSPAPDTSTVLNEKQNMAHEIITSHLRAHIEGRNPPQRLVVVHGQGGTGKTAMLNAIADTFTRMGASCLLAKTAMTGVAASIVRGQTLHTWAGLPIKTPPTHKWVTHPSKEMGRRRKTNMSSILWLTVDEMSMLTAPQLAWLSQVTSIIRTGAFSTEPSIPFGGMSVVLLGDMHQFPPIANTNRELYSPSPSDHTAHLGRTLFEQFETVIRLDKQIRIQDPIWEHILTRTRSGECNADDLAEIDRLVLGNANCVLPDFLSPPWNDCVLVTPRNAVQALWNEQMLKTHCGRSGYTRYIIRATDSARNHELTLADRLAIAHLKLAQTNRLPHKIEIAVGMKIMILTNVAPSAGVANGTRGTIFDIILDSREPCQDIPTLSHSLLYPPSAILFSPLDPSPLHFQGLPPGIVPLFPLTKTFRLGTDPGRTIERIQYSLTPAYAFTDHKSQGQTIECVIVDIAKPPSGGLDGFNIYVALSCSHGRKNIRLLRPFDHKLFTIHPNEKLRQEDERLRALETLTTVRFLAGEFATTS